MSWDKIKEDVEKNGNVHTFTMEVLRNVHGATRLGMNVVEEISQTLAGIGLAHVPEHLPNYQHEQVRLYKRGTPVGQLIDSVLTPGEQNDKSLVERFGSAGPDYAAMVQKVRDIVGE